METAPCLSQARTGSVGLTVRIRPFCGHQLQTCNCFMDHISPRPGSRKVVGRAVDAFDGMTAAQEAEWERALKREGRIPFIVYPSPPLLAKIALLESSLALTT